MPNEKCQMKNARENLTIESLAIQQWHSSFMAFIIHGIHHSWHSAFGIRL